MNETAMLENLAAKLADAVIANAKSPIPIEHDVWDTKTIGQFLKCSEYQVRTRFACLPDFPKSTRLPLPNGGWSNRRWKAKEIMDWYNKYERDQRRGK
ncbi:MAG: hypothetical protein NC211_03835 [Alistipes senegalensis]|nr:hypothetical protein [Oxalobacter formigenes]MCM1280949.1 hypothetical protein [Alistipes senegalensis]